MSRLRYAAQPTLRQKVDRSRRTLERLRRAERRHFEAWHRVKAEFRRHEAEHKKLERWAFELPCEVAS